MAVTDENGRWITVKGNHIFIKDGQTIEQALAERFDDSDWEPKSDSFDDYDMKPEIDSEAHKIQFKKQVFRGVLDASYKETKQQLISQYDQHKVLNPELESIIANHVAKRYAVQKIWSKGEWTGGGTYYSRYKRQVVLNVCENPPESMQNLFHELGHALDNVNMGEYGYASSKYISKTYGTTLSDMLKQEISKVNLSEVKEYFNKLNNYRDEINDLYDAKKIDYNEKRAERYKIRQAIIDITDTIQSTFEYDKCYDELGEVAHQKGYFNEKYEWYGPVNRGTEFFAEMTCDLICDENHIFSKYIKKLAPKSVEIYYEILKEVHGYGK